MPDASDPRELNAQHRHEVLLEEYRALWTYYMRTQEERRYAFDLYFKIVAVPLAIFGAMILYLRSSGIPSAISGTGNEGANGSLPGQAEGLGSAVAHDLLPISLAKLEVFSNGFAAFATCASVAGVATYAYYSLEAANSNIYLKALELIRSRWRRTLGLEAELVIGTLRPPTRLSGDVIVFSRGAIFVAFNSSLAALACWLWSRTAGLEVTWISGAPSVLLLSLGFASLHFLCGFWLMRSYRGSEFFTLIESELEDARQRSGAALVMAVASGKSAGDEPRV